MQHTAAGWIASLVCSALLVVAATAGAEDLIERLPPIVATASGQPPVVRLAANPDAPDRVLQLPGGKAAESSEEDELPPGARNGVFQRLNFQATWLPRTGGSSGVGMTDLELSTVLGFPFPRRDSPLLVTPGFAVHYLDGPDQPDLPPRLFDAWCQFRWLKQATPRLGIDLAVTPGVYSDFEHSSDDALRITGHGAGAWQWTPTTQIVLGATYLDRTDLSVLPIGGLIWKPHDDAVFELLFPRPRIAQRVYWLGSYGDLVQDWCYLTAEFPGGTWAVQQNDGTEDLVSYRDFRIIFGFERKRPGALSGSVEVGYVFGRRFEFAGDAPYQYPSDTVMLRAGLSY